MRKLVQVQEVEGEGLDGLLGQRITLFCLNYIYTGTLVGVNDTCVRLDDPAIVYETGAFGDTGWKDAQPIASPHYVRLECIESFGQVKLCF